MNRKIPVRVMLCYSYHVLEVLCLGVVRVRVQGLGGAQTVIDSYNGLTVHVLPWHGIG